MKLRRVQEFSFRTASTTAEEERTSMTINQLKGVAKKFSIR